MNYDPDYYIEVHKHGWILSVPFGQPGLPMGGMDPLRNLAPKNAIVAFGVTHHYAQMASGHRPRPIMAICTPEKLKAWEREIQYAISAFSPQGRWWYGTDVGASAAAMFAVLATPNTPEYWKARDLNPFTGPTPRDADDFGRCKRLIETFPEWRQRLPEVAAAYPCTAWPWIIERWDKLCAATPQECNRILSEYEPKETK